MSKNQTWSSLSVLDRIKWSWKAWRLLLKKEGGSFLLPTPHQLGIEMLEREFWSSRPQAHASAFGVVGYSRHFASQANVKVSSTHRTVIQNTSGGGAVCLPSAHVRAASSGVASQSLRAAGQIKENASWLKGVYKKLNPLSWAFGGSLYSRCFGWTWRLFTALFIGAIFVRLPLPWDVEVWSREALSFLVEALHSLAWISPESMQWLAWAWSPFLWPLALGICAIALLNELVLWIRPPVYGLWFAARFVFGACARLALTFSWYKKRIQEWLSENEHMVLKERVNKRIGVDKDDLPPAL